MRARWFVAWAAMGIITFAAVAQTSKPASGPRSRPASTPGTTTVAAGEQAYDTEEVSVFDASVDFRQSNLTRGAYVSCTTKPADGVKYPKTTTTMPCYGEWQIKDAGKYEFVVDSSTDGSKYDRLTIDLNRNQDLTDDEPIGWQYTPARGPITFPASFTFKIDIGDGGVRTVSAHMESYNNSRSMFFAEHPRQAWIKLGTREYRALLTHTYVITSSYDDGNLLLKERVGKLRELFRNATSQPDADQPEYWWGADSIKQMRPIDGTWYSFGASKSGDKLYVRPYHGDFGVFAVGAGSRNVADLGKVPDWVVSTSQPAERLPIISMRGSLFSKDKKVCIGDIRTNRGWPDPVEKATIPEGDYTAAILNVQMGRLDVMLSNNYHVDGSPRGRTGDEPVYGMQVRKDKPFVLDFSNKPDVVWPSPAKDAVVKRGQEVQIKAVLIDPKLDLMIRGLNDTGKKVKKSFDGGNDPSHEYEVPMSLDPKVTISDSSGKELASGVMPFG